MTILALVGYMMKGSEEAQIHWDMIRFLERGGCEAFRQYKQTLTHDDRPRGPHSRGRIGASYLHLIQDDIGDGTVVLTHSKKDPIGFSMEDL